MKFFDIEKVAKYLPSVEKPAYRQTFNTRLKWTGLAVLMYFVLSSVTIYGIEPSTFEQYRFFEIVLGSKFGSLMTLGIGPIVTGGIILQLLVGSKILNWDTTEEEGRKKFNSWNKFIAVALCFIEAAIFVITGAVPVATGGGLPLVVFVVLQLASGGIVVLLLDELVQKWGFSSGISLFIAAGVTSQILIRSFSPFPDPTQPFMPTGIFLKFLVNIFGGDSLTALINIIPLIATGAVFALVVYAQNIAVDIPLSFSSMRGFGRSWSLKLFYTSNIPVILTAALVANAQLLGRMGAVPDASGNLCSLMGCFDQNGNAISGVIYYLTAPRDLIIRIVSGGVMASEYVRAVTYSLFMAFGAMIFSIFWVSTSGMDAGSVAEQLESVGMQIPGYRRDRRIMESVLNRYVPALAVLGGLSIGLLAAFADFTGALGTGTGMLLTTMIVYNLYEELRRERLEEAHPIVRKIFGE